MSKRYSEKEIFDALTCDSSAEGCDPDWRNKVLSNANPRSVSKIRAEIIPNKDELPQETESRLKKEGKL